MSEDSKPIRISSRTYRVVDQREPRVVLEDVTVSGARSPEEAARQALGMHLTRSGKRGEVRARVYFKGEADSVSMVRLYRRIDSPD